MKENFQPQRNLYIKGLLIIARITGTIWVLLYLFGFAGYFAEGLKKNGFSAPKDWLGVATLVFLLLGLAGLVVAFWRQGAGVIISVSGFVLAAIFLICDPELNFSPVFLIIFLPSILYYAYWKLSRQ